MSTKLEKAMAVFGANAAAAPAKNHDEPIVTGGRDKISFGDDFDTLAALSILKDTFESLAKTLSTEIKDKARSIFAEKAFKDKNKPDTFIGTGVHADGQVQLRKRSSKSVLEAETLELLKTMKITIESGGVARDEDIPERIVLNPDVVNNQDVLKLVAKAIAKEPKLANVPVFIKQEAQAVYVTTDDTIAQVARKASTVKDVEDALKVVATLSVGQFHIDKSNDPTLVIPRALAILQKADLLPKTEEKKRTKKA